MKRNENIIPLSKDHHFGLLCSWKIRQGLRKEIEISRIKDYILYFWNHHLKKHFSEEEEILFLYLEDEYTLRIQREHQQIKDIVSQISSSENTSLISGFANLLEQHIRFEEREWFPHLEEKLEASILEKIGKELNDIHTEEKDDYEDEFWK
ncbi:hemerythrin-like domain-containing protein [Chryseobacterium sediminis]|uniref:Hemerythrin-like domain-containing protein n=1 Tax=Chryseobacterium sediminis TaxID=1679494 RepID=A0ABR6PVF2_9FLAO|nr:hemerythrin domain-containing protein [Chryseobacterium sediminis]MBB6329685.1 hemerythrin-like domain-containing protein [Chryseobacterium sediminis]